MSLSSLSLSPLSLSHLPPSLPLSLSLSLKVSIAVDGEQVKFHDDATQPSPSSSPTSAEGGASSEYEEVSVACVEGGNRCYRLEELAFLRSGDKGNTANIGNHFFNYYYLFFNPSLAVSCVLCSCLESHACCVVVSRVICVVCSCLESHVCCLESHACCV